MGEDSEDCCWNDIQEFCKQRISGQPCSCACHTPAVKAPRCFCPCHEYPGVYPPPCGYCGHDTREGRFPGSVREGWVPNLAAR